MGGAINCSFKSVHQLLSAYFLTAQTYKHMRLTQVYSTNYHGWKLPKACRQGTRNRNMTWSGLTLWNFLHVYSQFSIPMFVLSSSLEKDGDLGTIGVKNNLVSQSGCTLTP